MKNEKVNSRNRNVKNNYIEGNRKNLEKKKSTEKKRKEDQKFELNYIK